jgi:hypothetical protein
MKNNEKGSALLLALILGSVLILGLSALIGSAVTENRAADRAALASSAFNLAEAGIDRASLAIVQESFPATATTYFTGWTTSASKYKGTYTANAPALGGSAGNYDVVVEKGATSGTSTTYTVYSRGTVTNPGTGLSAQRAIKVILERKATSAVGPGGCVSLGSFSSSSTGSSTISATQIGPSFDSYRSSGNTAPGITNRYRNATVGTLSTANNALNLGNGSFYCDLGTGTGSTATTKVGYATNASNPTSILATIADTDASDDTCSTPTVTVANETDLLSRIGRDLDATVTKPIPTDISSDASWTQILPKNDTTSSQWAMNGKISDMGTKTGAVYSGGGLTLGNTSTSKTYIVTSSFDNLSSINVSGEAIIVVTGTINASNGLNINYLTSNAKLTIYAGGDLSGVITSTQRATTQTTYSSTYANYEASRLDIQMMPTTNGISVTSMDAAAIKNSVTTAITNGNTTGGTITMNFNSTSVFAGNLNAPYSAVNLSATGTNRGLGASNKMSDFCGSLFAKTLSVTGSNGFAFHYDEGLGSGNAQSPTLTLSLWRQVLPSVTAFN